MAEKDISPIPASDETDAISFLDFLLLLMKHRGLVFGLPAAAGLMALIVALLLPKWYTGTTKIMPPQQSQSNATALLGQLGTLPIGATQLLGLKNPSDTYVAMLKSRTVADNLIERFGLKTIYKEELLHYARKELTRNSSITAARDGTISVEFEDKDPKRAADIANAYVEELRKLTQTLAVSEAGQRRLFFEGQLKKAKNDLADAEVQLKKYAQQSGIVNPPGQLGLSVTAAAALRAQMAVKEIELAALRTFATDNNPDYRRTTQELAALRVELGRMENHAAINKGDVFVPFNKAPEVGLEYIRRYRDIKYFETLYEVLAKQYEIARIDEAKDATIIQVIDIAIPPDRHTKPVRALIVLLAIFAAGILAVTFVLARAAYFRARRRSAS
jgi:tyrosine-protein kinase Etk/Wzc